MRIRYFTYYKNDLWLIYKGFGYMPNFILAWKVLSKLREHVNDME
jgi:hypothetical protein